MIEQFRVKNFKALRDVTLDLTPIHVLIGPNDSGKTSILEALAALSRSVDHALPHAFRGSWSQAQLVWDNDPEADVVFAVETDEFHYELTCRFSGDRNVISLGEEFSGRDGATFKHSTGSTVSLVLKTMRGGGSSAHEAAMARRVYDGIAGVHLYRWVPRLLALPAAPDANRRFRMDSSGFGLALCLDDILGYDRNLFGRLESRLREIFKDVEAIRLLPEPAFKSPPDNPEDIPQLSRTDGKGIYFRFRGSEHDVPASQVSDGVLLVLAYLAVLSLPQPPRLLLIEEPENGIHPARLEEIIKILRDLVTAQTHTQVVLTTHSPYVLDLFQPNEITLCRKGADGAVEAKSFSKLRLVRDQLSLFTLGEIWTGEGDDAIAKSEQTEEEPAQ